MDRLLRRPARRSGLASVPSRSDVHRLRSKSMRCWSARDCCERRSIVDRPCRPRFKKLASKQPLRVVADSRLRIPFKSHILKQQHAAKTLVATTAAPLRREHALTKLGVEVVVLPSLRGASLCPP